MIKKAQIKDVKEILSLITYGSELGKVLPRSKKEIASLIETFYIWVEKEKIVGCCSLEIYSKKMAEIRSLVVLPKFQGKGIGTKLVKACMKKAKKENIYEVLSVTDKVNLFKQLGFQKCLNNQWPMFIRMKKENY